METQYVLSNGDVFEVNEHVTKSLEELGLNDHEREEVARDMARTAEWLIGSESDAAGRPASGGPVRPLVRQ